MLWLIGSGWMSQQYVPVLRSLGVAPVVVGRGEASARAFEEAQQIPVSTGGLQHLIDSGAPPPARAIVAVSADELYSCTKSLLEFGVRSILVEKPGGLAIEEVRELSRVVAERAADVVIAYNRRFYQSVLEAERIVAEDGGILSLVYEFTEWPHVLERAKKPPIIMQNIFLANSTHVVDLAFHLAGEPEELNPQVAGKQLLSWHPDGAIFFGSGRTVQGIPFAYYANWASAGRWGLELHTRNRKLILRPLEELQVQDKGSTQVRSHPMTCEDDKTFKAGLLLQTRSFLDGKRERFPTIHDQARNFSYYYQMLGRKPG